MTCSPIIEDRKKIWIEWLELVSKSLDGQPEVKADNSVFRAMEGDIHIAKLITGTLLATLKNEVVTIK